MSKDRNFEVLIMDNLQNSREDLHAKIRKANEKLAARRLAEANAKAKEQSPPPDNKRNAVTKPESVTNFRTSQPTYFGNANAGLSQPED